MPSKPTRIGFKAFVLCEAETGFLLEWKMYRRGEKETTADIVRGLLDSSRYRTKMIYMDRYFSNRRVFTDLLEQNIYACGTIDPSRVGVTEEMKIQIECLANEEAVFYTHDSELLLCIWRTHKGKLVYILSSILDTCMQNSERYCIEQKKMIKILRPAILEAYNDNMRGVDYFDRHLRYYCFLHGSKKWYQKIVYYFLEVAILNSYVIYQKECAEEDRLTRKNYIIDIIYTFLGMNTNEFDNEDDKNRKKECGLTRQIEARNCTVCSNSKIRARTKYYCKTCCCYVCAVDCYDQHRKGK
jgi:hypothetical protein